MFRRGLSLFGRALKANWMPAAGIWIFAALIVFGYYRGGVVCRAADWVLTLRTDMGIWFPMVTAALCGAILPILTQMLFLPKERPEAFRKLLYLAPFWFYKGFEIDLFYRFQSYLFGTSHDFLTIAVKVLFDQFAYTPTFGLVEIVLFMRWMERRGGTIPAGTPLAPRGWYGELVFPILVGNWALWIPAVSLVYMLPTALQLPLANLIFWFWSLMLLFMAKDQAKR